MYYYFLTKEKNDKGYYNYIVVNSPASSEVVVKGLTKMLEKEDTIGKFSLEPKSYSDLMPMVLDGSINILKSGIRFLRNNYFKAMDDFSVGSNAYLVYYGKSPRTHIVKIEGLPFTSPGEALCSSRTYAGVTTALSVDICRLCRNKQIALKVCDNIANFRNTHKMEIRRDDTDIKDSAEHSNIMNELSESSKGISQAEDELFCDDD